MNGAGIIAARLAEAGVREAYGIPGGEVLALVRGLDRAGVRFVLCKHENAGGFMAEGGWHANGAPGVLVATLGPGVANAVNVVANAEQDRVPLLFITGCVDAADAVTYTHQVFDHRAVLAPITKASMTVVDGQVDAVIDKALSIAMEDPPGPVHVDLPISVAAAEQPPAAPVRRAVPLRGGPVPGAALARARDWLAAARRPLAIVGMEALYQGAADAAAKFVTGRGIPLITTYKAKGVVPEDHPLCLGGAGLSPKADAELLPLVRQSDLLLLVGYDPIEMRTGWRSAWSPEARVVEFSAATNRHYMHQASASFVGDVGAGLRALDDAPAAAGYWPGGEPSAVRGRLRELFDGRGEEWGARAVIDVARRKLPRDTVATVDSGAHRILLSQMWECYGPRTLLQSTGLCTMGCALPLATGYKRAAPGAPVAAFVGDGCLEMVLGELATLRDSGLPVIVFVFVDHSLALIELKQRASGHDNVGVDFGATDFAAVASAMGGVGVACRSRDELAAAIDAALGRDGFTLLACEIGPRAYDGAF